MKSQKSAKELKDRTSIRFCNVIRDGKVEHINTDDVVVGDLVIIQSGEAIPADGYLVEGYLKVDNSVLNGESEDCTQNEILRYDLKERFGDKTSIIAGEIYKDGNDWKFHAVGEGYSGDLMFLCEKFGIEVS